MITESYKNKVAQDIADRADSVRINASALYPITTHEIVRNTVIVSTERVDNVGIITLAELVDGEGKVIALKETSIPQIEGLYSQIQFEFEVV